MTVSEPLDQESANDYLAEQRVGIYKTSAAARRAKMMMINDGVPSEQISLLAPEDPDGLQLATRRATRAPTSAWLGLGAGSLLGAMLGSVMGHGAISFLGASFAGGGRWVTALIGALVIGLLGALIGAIIGGQRSVFRTAFRQPNSSGSGTALGVVTKSVGESRAADYAFESTGAINVHAEPARIAVQAA